MWYLVNSVPIVGFLDGLLVDNTWCRDCLSFVFSLGLPRASHLRNLFLSDDALHSFLLGFFLGQVSFGAIVEY